MNFAGKLHEEKASRRHWIIDENMIAPLTKDSRFFFTQSADLALDGEWLLYTRTNGVSRCNTKSGKIEALADGIDIPLFVAAGDGAAYAGANFAFQGAGKPPKPAEILRLRPGAAPERLWSGMNRLTTMVWAGGKLYFAVEGVDGNAGASVLRIDVGSR